MGSPRKLIVIIPAYNEKERVAEVVSGLIEIRRSLESKGVTLHIYVIDDGSKDETGRLAREAGADRIIRHRVNRGLGAAVRSGLTAALADGADLAVKIDADLQHEPEDILELIRPILEDEADIVYGNRFDRIEYRMPVIRKAGNIVFTWLMRWLTGWSLKDSQPGIFAVSRDYLEVFHLPGDYNYTQQILLDAYHKGMRFEHVPVSFRERTTGKSFVSLKYPFKVLFQILLVLVSIRPMSVFVPIGSLFMGVAGLLFCFELTLWFLGETIKPVLHVNAIIGLSFFGLQTMFFGILAELIVRKK